MGDTKLPTNAMIAVVPLAATTVLLLLALVPLGVLSAIAVVATMLLLIQGQVFRTRMLARRFCLTTYLRQDSPLYRFFESNASMRLIAFLFAIPLSVLTYVAVFSSGALGVLTIAGCIGVGIAVRKLVLGHLRRNAPEHLVDLLLDRIFRWTSMCVIVVGLTLLHIIESRSADHSVLIAPDIADRIVEEVKHPIRPFLDSARAMMYLDLQLLRVRDLLGWPRGWIVYLYFVIPNALPGVGATLIFLAFENIYARRPRCYI